MTSRKQLAINQRALYDDAVKNKMFWNATPSFQEFQRRLQNPKYVQTVQANYRAHGRSGDAFDTLSGFRDYFCVSDEDRQEMTQGVGNMIADTKARLAGQQRYRKLKQFQDKQRGRYGRLDLGVKNPLTNDNVVRDDATDTYLTSQGVEYAQEQDAARAQNQLDETGKRYTEAVERGDLPSAFEVQDEDGNYALVEDLGVKPGVHVTEKGKQQQLAGLVNTRKSVEEQYNALYRKLEEDFKRSAPFSLNTHSQYGIDDNDMRLQAYLNSNAQYRRLKAQLHQLDNAIGVGKEAVKGRAEERYVKNAKGMLGYAYRDLKTFGASALRGLWNAVSDVSTWDLGLQDLQDNMTLYTTVKKARQKGYENLNSEERQMLDVAAKTGAYTAENQQYLGRGYKAGNVTGESLPFMVEMALNPASGLGEAAMSKYMRNAIAKYGKEAVRKEAWKYVTKKCGYRIAGDVLGAALMTGTTGSARTLADTYDRLTGDIKSTYDSNGKIVYDGTENEEKGILKAYLKAFGATAIENHSEFVGEYFNPLLKGAGTLTMKGWKKVNAKSANAFLDNLKDMGSTSTAKWLGNLFEKTQWHGTIGEYAEEVVGNIENALLVGDSTLDTKEGTGVFNLDQNIDTFLGVSLMGGFFSTLKTGAYVRDKVKGERKILMQQSLDLDNSIRYALGADPRLADKWKEWRVALAQGTDEEKKQALKEISENTNGYIKKAMYDYSANAQKLAGMDKATQGAIEDGTITPEQAQRDADIEQAHEEGLAAEGTARHDIQQEHQLRENSLARMLGISAEQLDRMEDEDIESMTGQNDALDTAIYDYQTSRERYQGVIDRATDEVEQAGIDAAHQIDLYTDHSTGQIRPCVIKGNNGKEDYQGYIVNGNIATHPDGAIDISGSDKMILYFDPETGKIEHGDASTFASLGESADATVARQQAIDEAKQQAAQAQSRDIDGGVGEDGNVSEAMPTSPQSSYQEERNAADFDIGQVVNAETGEVIPVSFEGLAEGENAYLTGGRPDGKTKDRLKVTIVDAEGNVTNRVMKRGNVQVDGRMSAEDFRNAYEEAVSSRIAPEADINGQENNVNEEGVVAGDAAPSADKAATSEEEGAASEPAVRDKNGNPIYDKMPISATIADLYDGALDDAEIDGFVSAQIAEAEKAVEKMEKKKPKVGTDKAKYLADKKAWEEGLQEAQRKVQYWQDVKAEVEKITTPEDARGYEEELNGDAAQTAYRNGSDAAAYGAREVTAEFMQSGDVKITPESYRKETGFGAAEQRAMVGKISKGGKSIDRLAEDLEVFDRENYNGMYFGGDSSVAKDAILDYLSSPDSRKGVKKMQSEAEREYVEAYEAERDRYYQEKYHMSYEEYLVYSSQEMPELLRKYSNFDEQLFLERYADEIEAALQKREEQLKQEENGKEGNVSAGEESGHGRSNRVQSGERTYDTGRGEVGKDSAGEVGPRHEGVVESEAALGSGGTEAGEHPLSSEDIEDGKLSVNDGRGDKGHIGERQGNLAKAVAVDDNGHPFILSSDGTSVFGEITEDSGLTAAPIRLSEGFNNTDERGNNIGYGLLHIQAGHGKQILEAGYPSVERFVEDVCRNYKEIRIGRNRKSNQTYMLLELHDEKHKRTLYVELSHDGTYWNVNSGGIFRNKYTDKNDIVWPEPTVGSNANTDTAEVADSPTEVAKGETVDRGGNSSQPISSGSKDTNNTDTKQENEEKSAGGEKEPMSPTPAMIDRMIEEQRVDDVSELLISSELKKAAEGIAGAFGMKVVYLKKVFIKSDDPAVEDFDGNGFVRNGVIYLSLKEADIAQFTFGHELLHQLKQIDPDSYMRIRQKVIGVMGRKAFEIEVKARQLTYANVPGYTLYEDYAEEVIADTLGDIITHTDMLPDIARSLKDNPSLLDRLLKVVDNVRQYFRGKIGGALGDLVNDIRDTYEMTARQGAETNRMEAALDAVNDRFNDRLESLIANPNQKDRVLRLGRSSEFLKDGGVADAEIVLEFDKLVRKSGEDYKNKHPFDMSDIKDLPKAIASPIAVFGNTSGENDGNVILTELKKDGKNFIVAVKTVMQPRKGGVVLEVNQITTLFPKEAKGIVHWFNLGKATNIDKEKALRFIEALPTHPGTTIKAEELISAANVVKDFETAKESEGKDRQRYASLGVSRSLGKEAAEGEPRWASLGLSEQQLAERQEVNGGTTLFSLKKDRTLAGVHNITEEKLLKALKQGGLANPSVAVIDSSKQNHDDYGDISLILPSDKVAKRTGKNAGTWQGDAWTPTYPQVERQMSNKGAEKASNDVGSVPSDMYSEVRRGLDRWLDGGEENSAMAYMFLHEKGVAPEPKKIQPKFSDEAYNELKSITAGNFNIYGIGKADSQKVLDMYIDAKFDGDKDLYEEKTKAWLERNKSIVDAGANGGMRYAIAKENVELYDEYGFNYKGVQTFVRDVEYDHRKTGVDMNATLNEVEDYIKTNNLTDEFNTWMEGKEKEYGIKEVIFDGFTPSGNRRYVPNTLENVSKIMKKQGRNGSTGISVSFQNFAARLMPSYGTLKDIRSKKGLLTSDRENLDKFREKWSNVFFELGVKCQPDATGTFDDYGLARLSEAAMTSDPQAYLKKEYNVDFSDEDTKRLKEMVKAIKEESPAMYFETKFERPVHLDEFAAAVVPTTASNEVKQALQNAGVQIYEYDKEKEGDRSRAFNEAINSSDNIRFSLDKDKGTVVSPSKPSKAEAVLRDAVIDRLRENGMEVITDVAEGQKVLDEANGRVGYVRSQVMFSSLTKAASAIRGWLATGKRGKSFTIELPETTRRMIRKVMGRDFDSHNITADGIRHGLKNHGAKGKKLTERSIPIRNEDAELIPYIMTAPDYVRKGSTSNGRESIRFYKTLENGYVVVVEKEFDNSDKDLETINIWGELSDVINAQRTLNRTSETPTISRSDAAKIRKDAEIAIAKDKKIREQRVYHGSGADFEAFDHGHMGEGQGSQVFGWGTYVTSSKAIGESYAESSSRTGGMEYTGDALTADEASLVGSLFISGMSSYHEVEEFLEKSANSDKPGAKRSANALALLRKTKPEEWKLPQQGKGQLYTVEIPEDNGSNYLDWENPLNDAQKEILKEGLMAAGVSVEYFKGLGFTLDSSFKYVYSASLPMMLRGVHVGEADNVKEKASRFLSGLGFTGIKYPAGTIHGGAEKGDMNYVIFNEKDAKITDHVRFFRTANGEAYGFTVGGKIYVDPRIATSETPVHEYAHLWASALRSGNKEEWQNVVGLMKDSKVWDEVKKRYPELKTDDEIADEVIATYSGQRGADRLREEQRKIAEGDGGVFEKAEAISALEKVKRALKMFWKGVADFLHIHYKSAEEVADRVMKDLLEGVDPRKMGNVVDGVSNQQTLRNVNNQSLFDAIHILYSKGKTFASQLFNMKFFDVAETPDFMKRLGLTGDKFTIRYGVISRHFGKDNQHDFTEEEWKQMPKALSNPILITEYYQDEQQKRQKGYRLYTPLKLADGSYVVVSAEVKNAGKDLEINAINTIFGRNAISDIHDRIIYQNPKITPEQSSLLNGNNPHQYPTDQELSDANIDNSSETAKDSEEKDRQRYASLGVSRQFGEEAAEGEPRWASWSLSEQQLDGDDTIRFSLNYDKWDREMASWLKRNRLPKNAQRPVVPQREIGESDLHFAGRLAKYNQDKALWNTAPKYEGHLSSGMTARGEFNYELQRGSVLTRIAVQDSMLAIRKAQEAIARHSGLLKVGTFEDAYMAENNSHGKAKNEFEQYDQEYLEPLRKWFNVMMKRLDGSYNNVTNYMIAKHGLERNAHMAFMAALEAEAKKAIDNTQPDAKRLRAQMVHDAYKQYKADSRRLINDADYEAGKYDYAQWRRTDDAIRKSYCSNYESFRYNKGGVVRDYAGLSSLFQNETDFEEKAAELCADIESKNGHETGELWDAVRQATRQILKNSHDAGMMSDETYDYVRGMYEHYIPLRGWNDSAADEVWDYAGGGRGVFNAALKEAHGRQSLADDPVAYIMNMAESGFLVNNRNWVKQHFLMMAMNHPSDLLTVSKAWYVKTKDQFGNEVWIPASPNIPADETDPAVIEAALDAFQTKMEQMEQSGDATQQRGSLNIEYPQTKMEEREHEVRVMKDGEEYVIYVNGDPQLAQALNNTRAMRVREHEGLFEKACAWLGRKMAAVYTSLSPLFVPSNWARDTTMTLASTAIREDARYNWLLRTKFMRPDVQMRMFGLVKEYQNGKLREKVKSRTATKMEENFWNFMINGGETGFVSTMDVDAFREKIQRDLKDMDRTRLNPVKVGHIIADSVEYINRVIEDSNRFAIYQTSIEYGRGIEEAVQDAKNVTLNFNRKGTGEMGMSAIRQLFLFINPAIQSLQTLGALAKEHKAKFTAVTSAWMASGMLVPLFNELMFNLASAAAGGGGDDDDEFNPKDEYWKFSSFDRRNNCILWIPFTHNFIKIPLAPEFRGFYGIGDMVASAMWGGENAKESWSNYAADLMGQIIDLSPLDPVSYDGNVLVSLMPNAIRPLVEIAQNVTFTGKPIYRESDFNKYDPSFKKAYAGTPDFLLRYSKWMNSIGNKYPEAQQGPVEQTAVGRYANNPAVIDHLLKSYLGGMYTLGSQIAGAITKASDEETRKDFKTADIPFFSKFVANPNDRPQSKNKGDAYWQDFEKYQRASHTLGVIRQDARKTGNFSVLEDFYKSEEYKEMKEYEPKAKQRKEEQKYEKWKEEGNADLYQPHQQTGEDVYKRHSTPADDFEDTKASILYQKIKPAKDIFDLADINTPSGMDTFNKYYDLAGKVEEAHSVKKEMNAIVKSFVNDEHKATFDPEKMKEYRALRKQYLQLVEDGNRMFEKIKAQRN